MRYFANPSTPKVRDAMQQGDIDMIATPKQGNRLPEGVRWCADNGCFGKGYPGDDAWFTWLQTYTAEEISRCSFAVAPDVVADAAATLGKSTPWLSRIRELGYPAAFVAQNGSEEEGMIPWGTFDVLFLGGDTAWKLGEHARHLTEHARNLGMPVHMGRVNSKRRLLYAAAIGCTSADGTYIAFGPDINLPTVQGWMRAIAHPQLWDRQSERVA